MYFCYHLSFLSILLTILFYIICLLNLIILAGKCSKLLHFVSTTYILLLILRKFELFFTQFLSVIIFLFFPTLSLFTTVYYHLRSYLNYTNIVRWTLWCLFVMVNIEVLMIQRLKVFVTFFVSLTSSTKEIRFLSSL